MFPRNDWMKTLGIARHRVILGDTTLAVRCSGRFRPIYTDLQKLEHDVDSRRAASQLRRSSPGAKQN